MQQQSPAGSIAVSRDAVNNNEKLFPTFKEHLSDGKNYVEAAIKLRSWMDHDKAYYVTGQRWIIELLQTAQETLARLGGGNFTQGFHVSACHDSLYLGPYVALVETLAKFRNRFGPAYRARVEDLIATVHPAIQREAPSPVNASNLYRPVQRVTSPTVPVPVGFPAQSPTFGTAGLNSPHLTPHLTPPFQGMISSPFTHTPLPPRSAGVGILPGTQHGLPAAVVTLPDAPSTSRSASVGIPPTAGSPPSIQQGLSMAASPALTSVSASSTASSASKAASGRGKSGQAKKPKRPVTFDFLEADLDWFSKQKEQEQLADQKVKDEQVEKTADEQVEQATPIETRQEGGMVEPPPEGSSSSPPAVEETSTEVNTESNPAASAIENASGDSAGNDSMDIDQLAQSTNLPPGPGEATASGKTTNSSMDAHAGELAEMNQSLPSQRARLTAEQVSSPSLIPPFIPAPHVSSQPLSSYPSPSSLVATSTTSMLPRLVMRGSPFDNMKLGGSSVRNVPELKIQPVRSSAARSGTSSSETKNPSTPAAVSSPTHAPSTERKSSLASPGPSSVAPVVSAVSPSLSTPLPQTTEDASSTAPTPALSLPADMSTVSSAPVAPTSASVRTEPQSPISKQKKPPSTSASVKTKQKARKGPPGVKELPVLPRESTSSDNMDAPLAASPVTTSSALPSPSSRKIRSKNGPPGVKSLDELISMNTAAAASRVETSSTAQTEAVNGDEIVAPQKRRDYPGSIHEQQGEPAKKKRKSVLGAAMDEVAEEGSPALGKSAPSEDERGAISVVGHRERTPATTSGSDPFGTTSLLLSSKAPQEDRMQVDEDWPAAEDPKSPASGTVVLDGVDESQTNQPAEEVPTAPQEDMLAHETTDMQASSVSTVAIRAPHTAIHDGSTTSSHPPVPPAAAEDNAASTDLNTAVVFQPREYTIEAFARGDFVYPKEPTPEDGEVTSPSPPPTPQDGDPEDGEIIKIPSTILQEEELGELTPIVSVKTLEDGVTDSQAQGQVENPEIPTSSMWNQLVAQAVEIEKDKQVSQLSPPKEETDLPYLPEDQKILACGRGSINWMEPLTLSFEATEEQVKLLKQWHDRYSTPDLDMSSTLCFSLSCYSFQRFTDDMNGDPVDGSISKLFLCKPEDFAKDITVWIEMNEGNDFFKTSIPRFFLTEDNLFDISSHVIVGKNTFKIFYACGVPQDWIFVLRLHAPSRVQLAELANRRRADAEWKKTLREMTKVRLPTIDWAALLKDSLLNLERGTSAHN